MNSPSPWNDETPGDEFDRAFRSAACGSPAGNGLGGEQDRIGRLLNHFRAHRRRVVIRRRLGSAALCVILAIGAVVWAPWRVTEHNAGLAASPGAPLPPQDESGSSSPPSRAGEESSNDREIASADRALSPDSKSILKLPIPSTETYDAFAFARAPNPIEIAVAWKTHREAVERLAAAAAQLKNTSEEKASAWSMDSTSWPDALTALKDPLFTPREAYTDEFPQRREADVWLMERLGDTDRATRRAAARLSASLRIEWAAPWWNAWLDESDCPAETTAAALESASERQLAENGLKSGNAWRRQRHWTELWNRSSPMALDQALALLEGPQRNDALVALSVADHPPIEALTLAMFDSSQRRRRAAILALSQINEPQAANALVALANRPGKQQEALLGLTLSERIEARAFLRRVEKDVQWWGLVRAAQQQALRLKDSRGVAG